MCFLLQTLDKHAFVFKKSLKVFKFCSRYIVYIVELLNAAVV